LPAVAYACRGYYSYLLNVEHPCWNMPSQSLHSDTTPVIQNVQSVANHQNQQSGTPSGNSQLPPAKRCISVPAGKRDSSHGGSSVPSTIQGYNSIPLSSQNNFCVADITQHVISTPSSTEQRSIITATATPDTSSCNTAAPSRTIQTDSTRCVVSSPHPALLSLPLLSPVSKTSPLHPEFRSPRDHYKATANTSCRTE